MLDRPEIPLHTNGSENDIRCQVTKRKLSGGTRSDAGRHCRDAFLGLAKTCAKASPSATIWATDSPYLAATASRCSRSWSASVAARRERPDFCPCYAS